MLPLCYAELTIVVLDLALGPAGRAGRVEVGSRLLLLLLGGRLLVVFVLLVLELGLNELPLRGGSLRRGNFAARSFGGLGSFGLGYFGLRLGTLGSLKTNKQGMLKWIGDG